jgi:hypothetical protein
MRLKTWLVIPVLVLAVSACANKPQGSAPAGNQQCQLPETKLLSTPLKAQETDQWCWAASGQMIMAFLNHDHSQCEQANNELGRSDCCQLMKPVGCVIGGWPEFGKYDFNSDRTFNAGLVWDQLREQIACNSTPVAFSWHWNQGGGHMMVIRGYTILDGVSTLYINNPWPPVPGAGEEQIISYEEYIAGSDHTHWDDFYNIRHK